MSDTPLRTERDGHVVRLEDDAFEIGFDPDGEVWYVRASSVPGLSASADTLDDLVAALPGLARQVRMP